MNDTGAGPGTEPRPLDCGLHGLCPRCGAKTLFRSYIQFADRCSRCALDFSAYNVGDGPAAFLTLILGTIVVTLAITLELTLHPPFWVHVLIWPPFTAAGVVLSLRIAKGWLIALEYRNARARGPGEGSPRMRRWPVMPTIVVAVAVAAMIALGLWQLLDRLPRKEAYLAQLAANPERPPIAFPRRTDDTLLFRRASLDCRPPVTIARAGAGAAGYRLIAICADGVRVQLGTTRDPAGMVAWGGGVVAGFVSHAPIRGL